MPTTLHLPALPELIQSIEKAGFQLLVAPVPVPQGAQRQVLRERRNQG